MYKDGLGVTQDYQEAFKWYRLATEQGDAHAQVGLGVIYYDGLGVTQDYQEAFKWYRLAAEQGDTLAMNNLARMYYYGEGVIEDDVLAHMWFNLAATNGDKKTREVAKKNMEAVAEQMTSEQITKATELGRECILKFLKDCG
jgi:TPR repeat protein